MKMHKIDVTEIEGFRLGNAEDEAGGTGCTAIICEKGAVGGVDVRGGGPATRETDLLKSENTVESVNAVVLSGGSAFGLEAASGVMRALSKRGVGFRVGNLTVPIVCGASLFDLAAGSSETFPDVAMGIKAAENAFSGIFENGNHGAGTGATVGKILGPSRAMKTGLGTFACGDDRLQVGAIVAVNACGDIYNGAGNIIAGLRTEDGSVIHGTIRTLKNMIYDLPVEVSEPEAQKARDEEKISNSAEDITKALEAEYIRKTRQEIEELKSRIEFGAQGRKDQDTGTETEAMTGDPADTAGIHETCNDTAAAPESVSDSDDASPITAAPEEKPSHEDPEQEVPAVEDFDAQETEAESEAVKELPAEKAEPAVSDQPVETDQPEEPEITAETGQEETEAEGAAASEEEPVLQISQVPYIDDGDLGYDIPFNTTIGCLITNARITKSQANKLASILHDAFARAIKPVHSTLDGDTIFVLSTCTQNVNFDAFAALATDVMQYAVIDGAVSAKGAYGLPASHDL